jgi:hypothetical protein
MRAALPMSLRSGLEYTENTTPLDMQICNDTMSSGYKWDS